MDNARTNFREGTYATVAVQTIHAYGDGHGNDSEARRGMTQEEEDELRSELRAARTTNAYLFLAIEALGKVALDMPRALAAHSQEQAALQGAIRQTTLELDKALKSAAEYIWDENGIPL